VTNAERETSRDLVLAAYDETHDMTVAHGHGEEAAHGRNSWVFPVFPRDTVPGII